MTHQPAISFSISFQHPFNRAGGRTSNVRQKIKTMDMEELNEIYRDRFLNAFFASYSMIGVLAGIVVAVAAIIRTPSNFWLVDWVGILAIINGVQNFSHEWR